MVYTYAEQTIANGLFVQNICAGGDVRVCWNEYWWWIIFPKVLLKIRFEYLTDDIGI